MSVMYGSLHVQPLYWMRRIPPQGAVLKNGATLEGDAVFILREVSFIMSGGLSICGGQKWFGVV